MQARPSGGTIAWRGQVVRWGETGWKSRIAYVRESPSFYDELTVGQTLTLSSRLYGRWDAALAAHMAGRLGLQSDRRVATLSKGTRVKLGIVAALGHRADLLVLDEPTAGVDPSAREELHHLLADLRRERPELCVLLSSHIFEDLEASADDVLILRDGKVVFQVTREQLQTLSLYRVPSSVDIPESDDVALTWIADDMKWTITEPGSATGLRLRGMPGCVDEGSHKLLQAIYRGTGHAVAELAP
jgi:ABC-type multidrug transport system ATPase subunit